LHRRRTPLLHASTSWLRCIDLGLRAKPALAMPNGAANLAETTILGNALI